MADVRQPKSRGAGNADKARRFGRRRFVRLGLAGGAVVGLGGLLAWQTSGYDVPERVAARLRALTPKEYLVVGAIAGRMLRSDAPDLPSADEIDVGLRIDTLVTKLDEGSRTDLKRLLHVVEHALPAWTTRRMSRFTRLDGFERDAVLEAMQTSSTHVLRGAFDAMKSLCVMAYFSHERTWGAIGYDGPLVGRPAEGWARGR